MRGRRRVNFQMCRIRSDQQIAVMVEESLQKKDWLLLHAASSLFLSYLSEGDLNQFP
jgi:hypothetical protein